MPFNPKTGFCSGKCPHNECKPSVGSNLKRRVPLPSGWSPGRDQLSQDYARWEAWHQGVANAPEPPTYPRRVEQEELMQQNEEVTCEVG